MNSRKLSVILLCDAREASITNEREIKDSLESSDWMAERHCMEAMKEQGHNVRLIGIYNDIRPFLVAIGEDKPDIIFNMVEEFDGQSFYERNIVGLYELLQVPYTGANPASIVLCKNKALTKEILSHHKINVPGFKVYYRRKKIFRPRSLKFPLIIKPLRDEASTGIARASLIANDDELMERIGYIHDTLGQDAIAEEYIEGRELYVSIIGNKNLTVLPIRELLFSKDENGPNFATYKVKWDKEYRNKWNIRYGFAKFDNPKLEEKIFRVAKRAYRVLRIKGYARVDIRLTPDNEIYIIEANPNPALDKEDEFAKSAMKAGMEYKDLIQRIINLGLEYQKSESIQE